VEASRQRCGCRRRPGMAVRPLIGKARLSPEK
jgi:hypothetical protein